MDAAERAKLFAEQSESKSYLDESSSSFGILPS
eukprot:CAMPEP_0171907880 /NCGR_PEP_ID=MMETSP0993-20121228/7355_1 /TAXON_ID=483369 /ORGANISM="non described non described, Strain CCMP2098" /LENGTH=32 /DNA_ID= /DNA_START= /DNA_END= /DNA_ORIENTATION=